jgi:hypothetical protein
LIINRDYSIIMRQGKRLLKSQLPVDYMYRHEKDCWEAIQMFLMIFFMIGVTYALYVCLFGGDLRFGW